MATLLHINSNLLRQPRLFDKLRNVVGQAPAKADEPARTRYPLGNQVGRLARDLILYAAWNGAPVVRLHVPEFCELFGYDRAVLLRRTTPEQDNEMRACSLPEKLIKYYSNFLGYTLVKMLNYNFLWNERSGDSRDHSVQSNKMVQKINPPRVRRKRGTYVEFIVSPDIVEQNRDWYQTLFLEDYLSLRTSAGYAWDAARTLYMRVRWKRAYWDRPNQVAHPKYHPSRDSYRELVAAAGLDQINPTRKQASMLLAMLRTVGELPSVCMVPQMHYAKGKYYVTWTRYELHTVGGPPKNLVYEVGPAPDTWGTDPNPPSMGYQDDDEQDMYVDASWSGEAPTATSVWAGCMATLAPLVGEQSLRKWFRPLVATELADKVLTVQVPSLEFYEHLEANYVDQLKLAIHRELGDDGQLEYSLLVEEEEEADAT